MMMLAASLIALAVPADGVTFDCQSSANEQSFKLYVVERRDAATVETTIQAAGAAWRGYSSLPERFENALPGRLIARWEAPQEQPMRVSATAFVGRGPILVEVVDYDPGAQRASYRFQATMTFEDDRYTLLNDAGQCRVTSGNQISDQGQDSSQ